MRRQEVLATIDAYLSERETAKQTGKTWVEINMSQGGFGAPQFFKFEKDETKLLTNKLRFEMID